MGNKVISEERDKSGEKEIEDAPASLTGVH
jgi:hypothetical protein